MNKLDWNDMMMNAPSTNQGIGRTVDNIWAAPSPPTKHGKVNACHDHSHSWLYIRDESPSLWSTDTFLDNDVPMLKDNVGPTKHSHDTHADEMLNAMAIDDYIWQHDPDSLAHIVLPNDHDDAIRERESIAPWNHETVPCTSTYGYTWLVPVLWDERDEDARFWSNTKKQHRGYYQPSFHANHIVRSEPVMQKHKPTRTTHESLVSSRGFRNSHNY